MAIPEWNGYVEKIEYFSFREKAAIKILKVAREKAYSMQIDIEILSTRGNDYKNYKSIPAHSFYGYVVLVMRDFSEIQIPIMQPRQTVYYERREDAYTNWYALYLASLAAQNLAWISEFNLKPIAEALGLTSTLAEPYCPTFSGFEEVRLREVYVKCSYGTRFAIGVSRWEPLPAVYGSCAYDGNSRVIDDAPEDEHGKDKGLPDTGSQPQASPNADSPYDGFDPPSDSQELGDWDNSNEIPLADEPNEENAPTLPTNIRLAKVVSTVKRPGFDGGCANKRTDTSYYLVLPETTVVSIQPNAFNLGDICGNGDQRGWDLELSGGQPFNIGYSDSTPSVTFEEGTILPPDTSIFDF